MTKLRKYQKQGVRKIDKFRGRALLADEMGLGKTIQFLKYMRQHHKKCLPAVVVCPASLKWNWAKEAMQHIKCRAEVLEGTNPPRASRFEVAHRLTIVNYRILPYWLDWIEEVIDPQLVGIDECQYIKNRNAQRTKAVKWLCKGVPHVVMMSGTPLTSRPAELYPALNILLPKKYKSFMTYAWKYCRPRHTPWGWQYRGATNLDQLHRKLRKSCMIRRRKTDVLDELPEKTRVVIPVELSREDRKEYDYAENNFLRWLTKTQGKAKAKRASKAQQIQRMGYLKRLAATLKLPHVMSWIDDFFEDSEDKLVAFAVHKKIIGPMVDRYRKKCVVVDGNVVGRQRQLAVDKFQSKPKTKLFVGNVQAAGVGLTLTAASTCCMVELPWTPGECTQAEDRIHRIGQTNAAMCYYLVAHNTVDEDLALILQKKQQVLEATLDGEGDGDDLDIYDQLAEAMRRRRNV